MTKQLQILFISTTDRIGGAAQVGWSIGEQLDRKGIKNYFIVDRKTSNDNKVYQLSRPFWHRLFSFDVHLFIIYLRSFLFSEDLSYGADEEIFNHPFYTKADIVHLHNLHGNYFKLSTLVRICKEKKVIWTLHDMWALMPHGAWSEQTNADSLGFYHRPNLLSYPPMLFDRTSSLSKIKKQIYTDINVNLVTPSYWLRRKVQKSVLNKFPIKVIHNGVDLSIFKDLKKSAIRQKLKFSEDKKVILFLANRGEKNKQKGWEYARSAFQIIKRKFPETILLCVGGDRTYVDQGIYYIEKTQDQIKVAEFFVAADVYLLPSLFENFPLTGIYALAGGTPIVGFDVGGIEELLDKNRFGKVVKKGDVKALANSVMYYLNKSKSQKLSFANKSKQYAIQNFSIEKMVDQYLSLYRSINV